MSGEITTNAATNDAVRIVQLQIDNVKKIRAVGLTPAATGLTSIGGNNAQGKTSVLDAIMGALLGDKFKPSLPVRDGAQKGETKITLSNGFVVERNYSAKGGSYLTVTAPDGGKHGQTILNEFLAELALNLGDFLKASDKQKSKILLQAVGVDTQPYDEKIAAMMQERLLKGRERDNAKGHYESLPYHEDYGTELADSTAIAAKLQQQMNHNSAVAAAYQDARAARDAMTAEVEHRAGLEKRLAELQAEIADSKIKIDDLAAKAEAAIDAYKAMEKIDTEPTTAELKSVEATNAKVRDNQAKANAKRQHSILADEYTHMTREIEALRDELKGLLDANPLPLDGLAIEEGELLYNGQRWDNMSGAERLQVATAVCHLINPRCGFVLIDGLETMDALTLVKFDAWLQDRGLQAIGTRVSTGDECTIIITDGAIA